MESLAGFCILCSEQQTLDTSRTLKCGHLFHIDCIESWFENREFCPICREKDETKIELFRPSFDTKKIADIKKIKPAFSNETMKPFLAYESYKELRKEVYEKVQNIWKWEEIIGMDAGRVYNIAMKSHSMCRKSIKNKVLFDAYHFALRTYHLFKSMEKTVDFNLFYRNHEYEFKNVAEENYNLFYMFEMYLSQILESRTISEEENEKILEAFEAAISSNGKEHQSSSFHFSLPNSINL